MAGIIISIILFIVCIMLTGIVLMQQGKSAGLSGAVSGVAESYFGKNKARTMEGKFERITKILAAIYIILSLVLYFVIA
ncbi:MAG: preprotein translocase subunit SecG [Lachnospiraceae bacterium]|jgi:preprotein translocase subunit SecG|nr:preprotein translocase subunit SecG [Lachnospiraceae bacterium]